VRPRVQIPRPRPISEYEPDSAAATYVTTPVYWCSTRVAPPSRSPLDSLGRGSIGQVPTGWPEGQLTRCEIRRAESTSDAGFNSRCLPQAESGSQSESTAPLRTGDPQTAPICGSAARMQIAARPPTLASPRFEPLLLDHDRQPGTRPSRSPRVRRSLPSPSSPRRSLAGCAPPLCNRRRELGRCR
jgi:hypothetical protein